VCLTLISRKVAYDLWYLRRQEIKTTDDAYGKEGSIGKLSKM